MPCLFRPCIEGPRVGTLRLQNAQAAVIQPVRYSSRNISIRQSFGIIRLKVANPWLVSSTSSHPALSKSTSIMKGLGRSSYFAFRGLKWYARPVTLRIPALI